MYPIAPRSKIYKKMYSEHPRLLYSLRLAAGRSLFPSKRIVSKSPSKPSSGPLGGRFIRGWGWVTYGQRVEHKDFPITHHWREFGWKSLDVEGGHQVLYSLTLGAGRSIFLNKTTALARRSFFGYLFFSL